MSLPTILKRFERTGNSRARLLVRAAPLVVGFWLLGHGVSVQAQDFVITSTADRTGSGDGSLRDAIIQANALSTADRIILGANTYPLTLPGQDNTAMLGDLDITRSGGTLTIQGAGAAVTIIDANMIDRAFEITNGATVIFKDLTIRHGLATDSGALGGTLSLGGAILTSNGIITLDHVVLDGNAATGAPGAFNTAGADALGGAVYVSGGSLTLIACTLSNNTATGGHGGVGATSSPNGFPGGTGGFAEGGAIYLSTGTLDIGSSTVGPGNMCQGGTGGTGGDTYGGGITGNGGDGGGAAGAGLFSSASAIVTNSTISSNTATGGTGGVSIQSTHGASTGNDGNGGPSDGAGIDSHANSTLQLNNSTVANNTDTPGPGGNFMFPGSPGTATGGGLEFTGTTAAVDSTILSGNTAAIGPQASGTLGARFSLFDSVAGVTFGTDVSNIKNVPAGLQPLAQNGGPTQTHAILASSPAHDAGENPVALTTDQRGAGFPRVSGPGADSGAYELDTAPIIASITASSVVVKTGVVVTFTAQASDPQGFPLTYSWDFNDSTAATGNPVTHAFASEGAFTVALTVSDGVLSTQTTLTIQALAPNSGAASIQNIDDGAPPVVNPETGVSIGILSSDGGVIEFVINIDSLLRATPGVSTEFDSISGRTGTETGLHFIHKFSDPGIVVATTTVTDPATGAIMGRGRKTLVISEIEVGNLPPQIKLPTSHKIHVTSVKGSFHFAKPTAASAGKPDLVTFAGSVELPAGMDLSQKPQIFFSIGNIVDSVSIDAKGHAILPSAKGRIKKLQFMLPKLAKGTTQIASGQTAKFLVTINQQGLSDAGFDTDGVTSAVSASELKMKSIPRNIQVGMLIAGVPYSLLTPVSFKLAAGGASGTISGRSGN